MVKRLTSVTGVLAAAALYQAIPSVAAIGWLRRALLPGLAGLSAAPHVALTFDDGPHPDSTPAFLDELARLDTHATFFVLGEQLTRYPELGRRITGAGHDIAIHGWTHRCHLLQRPRQVTRDMSRTHAVICEIAGAAPKYWRPPYGIPTTAGFRAASTAGVRPVLWTADGHDWEAEATGASVSGRVVSGLERGGVILLHDADTTTAPGAWRAALAALPPIVRACRNRGWDIGPLSEHALDPRNA